MLFLHVGLKVLAGVQTDVRCSCALGDSFCVMCLDPKTQEGTGGISGQSVDPHHPAECQRESAKAYKQETKR